MAAGRFTWYNTAMKQVLQGTIDLDTAPIMAVLVADGYTPSTASDSTYAAFSANIATASTTPVAAIQLTGVVMTGTGQTTVKWTADNIDGFSHSAGVIGSAKWVILAEGGTGDNTLTALSRIIGFIDLNTAASDASVGGATQINVTWTGGTISEFKSNP